MAAREQKIVEQISPIPTQEEKMTQRMYLGHQGSGKTWRALFDFEKTQADVSIFLDTKNSIKDYKHKIDAVRITKQNQIGWDEGGRFILSIDPDDFYFGELIEIIEMESGMHSGTRGRKIHLTIDEAYIYTMEFGELCERMALWSRAYYDIDWISQRVQMLRTPHGSTIFTQIDKYYIFFVNKFEREYLRDVAGIELDDEEVAWLSPLRSKFRFNYVSWNNIQKEFFDSDGEKVEMRK